jgi:hypothetical protein
MSAATSARLARYDTIKFKQLPLAGSVTAYQGTMCAADTSAGVVTPAASGSTTLLNIGQFDETINNSSNTGTVLINVCLDREIKVCWYQNATGANAVTQLFSTCYMLDNQTVQSTSSGNSRAGRVWAISTTKGVAVESLDLV